MADTLADRLDKALLPNPPRRIGVAVSGGSDSMALLHLLHQFCERHGVDLHAVTVDHDLRAEAAAEAAQVARYCQGIGVSHDTLVWDTWSGKGNLQSMARNARYQKMAHWAQHLDIETIAVGHTADDQAETVLMRLSRRSGVDGLAGMSAKTLREGINWVRPLLGTRRAELRDYLEEHQIAWINDPSNEDERYDRIKARKALELLTPLGVDTDALVEVSAHLAQARKALEWHTFLAAKHIVRLVPGAVVMDEAIYSLQVTDVQRRLLIKAITWVSGSIYAPRRSALAAVKAALFNGQAATVDGCHIRRISGQLWIFRELKAVSTCETPTNAAWDARWRLAPVCPVSHDPDLRIRALGDAGLQQCPNWRTAGRPHVALQSTPGIWKGDELIAAPLAGYPQNWRAEFGESSDTFFATLLSH